MKVNERKFSRFGEQASRRTFGETVKQRCHFMKIDSQIKCVLKTRLTNNTLTEHEFKEK
jgi:hypothetical protein